MKFLENTPVFVILFNNFLSAYPPKEIDFVDHWNGTADIESGIQ